MQRLENDTFVANPAIMQGLSSLRSGNLHQNTNELVRKNGGRDQGVEIPLLLPTFSCSNWNLECWSLWREENRRTREKTLGARTNNKPITNPSYVKYQPLEPVSWRPGNLRDPKSCFVFYPDGFSKGLNIMQRSCQVKKKTWDCLGGQNLLIILMKST